MKREPRGGAASLTVRSSWIESLEVLLPVARGSPAAVGGGFGSVALSMPLGAANRSSMLPTNSRTPAGDPAAGAIAAAWLRALSRTPVAPTRPRCPSALPRPAESVT